MLLDCSSCDAESEHVDIKTFQNLFSYLESVSRNVPPAENLIAVIVFLIQDFFIITVHSMFLGNVLFAMDVLTGEQSENEVLATRIRTTR